jgi:hypothetical protein
MKREREREREREGEGEGEGEREREREREREVTFNLVPLIRKKRFQRFFFNGDRIGSKFFRPERSVGLNHC